VSVRDETDLSTPIDRPENADPEVTSRPLPSIRAVFTDEQVEAAVRALSDPARFAGSERTLAQLAPQLQRVLAHALEQGGWFGEAHRSQVRQALAEADPIAREERVETLVAEETRMAMLVGVAVGWELARELDSQANPQDPQGD
jgi:hypothetical protein